MLNEVKEFHEVFNHPINATLTPDLIELRFNLIEEEWVEAAEELANLHLQVDTKTNIQDIVNTKAKLTKELSDMLYVIYGTAIAFGLPLEEVFKEVHNSNMSKLGEDGQPIFREDGKVLKGPNYKEPNLEQFFNE